VTGPLPADPGTRRDADGFALPLDRGYHPATHMWVQLIAPGVARIGMDPLGVQTSGTLAHLSLPAVGERLAAGRPFGQLEAVKFVGPLISPVSGTVRAVNDAVPADPGRLERDPLGDGWLIDADLADPAEASDIPAEASALLTDPEAIIAWYTGKIAEYRLSGAIAQ
jgi:glycine cleavage system H protein